MMFFLSLLGLTALFLLNTVHAFLTDTLMDGDSAQSGYLPNHNMDPAIVSGGSFGQIWRYQTQSSAEQFYAKPLVYTPKSTGRQVVISISEMNKIYVLDAVNGTLLATRDLSMEGESPFLVADLGSCNDISGTIGVTGTPVIDPTTDTLYFWAKSYLMPGQRGYLNGAYRFHGVDAATLVERPGFPTNPQGQVADNDHTRYFTGGTVLQRVSLNLVNGVIFAGFGGHCDQYNFTGWVVGMSTAGKYVTGYVTSGGPGAPPQDGTFNGGGGGSGVWMSGMPITSDNSGRIFFATGNGYKTDVNQQQPASGRVHLDTLSECVVNLAIDGATGALTQADYFESYEYLAMDAADRDLGSGGVSLPDPGTFSGGGIARLAITCGKNAKCYVMNADNLGGYKLGPGGSDAIVQTLTPPSGGSIFGNVGTYPLEGGYLYVTPVGSPTYVYKLGYSASGTPLFTLAGQTADVSAGRVGVGPATITTNNGAPGSAILWIMDVDAGIRAYNAVPVGGTLTKITLPASPFVSKFMRPAFGNGRYYVSTTNGNILAFGSPVALPLTCTSPIDFGSVAIGTNATAIVKCTANIAITQLRGFVFGKPVFKASNSSLPSGPLAAGATFSFQVVFDLNKYVLSSGSTSAPAVSPGVQTTSISILTTNSVSGYATEQPISLTGTSVSSDPFISIGPLQVSFAPLTVNTISGLTGSDSTFVISNIGTGNMTILGYAFTAGDINPGPGDPPVTLTNVSFATTALDSKGIFVSSNLPLVGTIVPGGQAVTVTAHFQTNQTGDYFTTLKVYSNGGDAYTSLVGSANTPPVAVLEQSVGTSGVWKVIPNCSGTGETGCTYQINMGTTNGPTVSDVVLRLTNLGGSALIITKSKPPVYSAANPLGATNPYTDFTEGQAITPNSSAKATISFSPGPSMLNGDDITYSGIWTLNTNDLMFGVHKLNFTGTLTASQTGPLTAGNVSLYKYLGCYLDSTANRIESKQFVNQNNTNGVCQTQAYNLGAIFAGTEYVTECYVGSIVPSPSLLVANTLCGYSCAGDNAQFCGGNGGYISIYYDSSRYFPQNGTIIGTSGKGPRILSQVGNYNYMGCYVDSTGQRTLSDAQQAPSTNTLESCAAFCSNHQFFGTEYGAECYCGNTLGSYTVLKPDTDCSMICAGNSTEYCGNANRLSVYHLNGSQALYPTSSLFTNTSSVSLPSQTVSQSVSSMVVACPESNGTIQTSGSGRSFVLECFVDYTAGDLSSMYAPSYLGCLNICDTTSQCVGFSYVGGLQGGPCYLKQTIGPAIANSGVWAGRFITVPSSTSNVTTTAFQTASVTTTASTFQTASPTTTASALSTSSSASQTTSSTTSVSQGSYPPTNSTVACPASNGTIFISTQNSTFRIECFIDHAAGDLTLQYTTSFGACINACASTTGCVAFSYAGVNQGTSPCYLKKSVGTANTNPRIWGGKMIPLLSMTSTTLPTSSATTRSLSTSLSSPSVTSPSSTTSLSQPLSVTTSSTPSTSITTTSVTSYTTGSAVSNAWVYVGCANDTVANRALGSAMTYSNNMTVENCQGFCYSMNYPLAGLEFGNQCYCGMSLSATIGATGCSMTCSGNSAEICGGTSRLSVYNYTSYVTPVVAPAVGKYNLQGCYTDTPNNRILNQLAYFNTNNQTIENCVATCLIAGYSLAGVEYGDECYCGNSLQGTYSPTSLSDCKVMPCSGNKTELCGAANRILIYSSG